MRNNRLMIVLATFAAAAGALLTGGGGSSAPAGMRALQAATASARAGVPAQPGTLAAQVKGVFGGGNCPRPPSPHYRRKPWTCTAIEQRKARKRRNQKRHKARVQGR